MFKKTLIIFSVLLMFSTYVYTQNTYLIIVIPVDKTTDANKDADKVDKGKTSRTFTVGLSPDGKLPITHYWCCWWVSPKENTDLRKDFQGTPDQIGGKHNSRVFDRKDWTPEQVLEKLNLKLILSKI